MKTIFFTFACAQIVTMLACAKTPSARELDVSSSDVDKAEIRYSMAGPRDTVIFYTFPKQDAVLELNIERKDGKFLISAIVQLFAEGTGAEKIARWINNQHSDGLYPEVPKPVTTVKLADDACTVVESKAKQDAELEASPVSGEKFQDHTLKIKVGESKSEKGDMGFTLKGFTIETSAFVKVNAEN